jgi:hypothetical protein
MDYVDFIYKRIFSYGDLLVMQKLETYPVEFSLGRQIKFMEASEPIYYPPPSPPSSFRNGIYFLTILATNSGITVFSLKGTGTKI